MRTPRVYQRACLDKLEEIRNQGRKKTFVIMATGLGKTFTSAYEVKRLLKKAPGRVLYLCHSTYVLDQAHKEYESILGSDYSYGFFHGTEKNLHDVDVLFASFQTMASWRTLFAKNEFRYIVVDEVHRAQAATFQPTVEYFDADFLLGLTATPYRGDGLNIADLFGEYAFRLELFEALAKRYTCDIDYRIMTDELQNLEVLDTPTGKLSIKELNRKIFVPKRDEEIARIIQEKAAAHTRNPRIMVFCASIQHADNMAALMPNSVVLHSDLSDKKKDEALRKFRSGAATTIITVDALNEGFDVPDVNVVVFLRSTCSLRIFLQQLGRGARWVKGKILLALDFVANCQRFEMIEQLQKGVKRSLEAIGTDEDDGLEPLEGTSGRAEAFTLTLDGVRFNERVWKIFDVIEKVRLGYTVESLSEQLLRKAQQIGRAPTRDEVNADPEMASVDTFTNIFGTNWNSVLKTVGLALNLKVGYTKAELTEQLRNKVKKLGRTPSGKEVDADPEMASTGTFRNVFNTTWNGVLKELELKYIPTKDDLIRQLRSKAKELGKNPTQGDVKADPDMAPVYTFTQTFKSSWNGVLKAAGFEVAIQPDYTIEQLTQQLLRKAKELGKTPTTEEVDVDPEMASSGVIKRVFGTNWNGVLRRLNLGINRRNYTKEQLTQQLLKKAEELGKTPTIDIVRADPEMANPITYMKAFGTNWSGVLEALDLKVNIRRNKR